MSNKYKARITLLFNENERLDNLLLYMLEEISTSNHRPEKIKELVREMLKKERPEVYEAALRRLEGNNKEDSKVVSIVDNVKSKKDDEKLNLKSKLKTQW